MRCPRCCARQGSAPAPSPRPATRTAPTTPCGKWSGQLRWALTLTFAGNSPAFEKESTNASAERGRVDVRPGGQERVGRTGSRQALAQPQRHVRIQRGGDHADGVTVDET